MSVELYLLAKMVFDGKEIRLGMDKQQLIVLLRLRRESFSEDVMSILTGTD